MDLDMMVNTIFEGTRWHRFHDAVLHATNVSHPKEKLRELFLMLPKHIQMTAFEWGLNDTEFGEAVYEHIINEKKGGDKYT